MYIIVVFKKKTRLNNGFYQGCSVSKDCEVYEFDTIDEARECFFNHLDEWQSKGYDVARYKMI